MKRSLKKKFAGFFWGGAIVVRITLPQTSDFLYRTFRGCSTRGRMQDEEKTFPCISLVAKDYRTDDIEVARRTVFQEIRPGAGFKAGVFAKEESGRLP